MEEKVKKRKKLKISKYLMALPYFVLLFLFILVPILLMVIYSFKKNPDQSIFQINFTFNNYKLFFSEYAFLKTMGESIYIAFLTTVICFLIGYPLAYFITKQKPRIQSLLFLLITAPMWINMLIRTLALKQIFTLIAPGIIGSTAAIIIGMVYIFLPFMVIPIYTVLSKIDNNLLEAANDLGANSFKSITKVLFPLSVPGIFSGILMVFLPAATSLIVPAYLGRRKFMIGSVIEAFVKLNENVSLASATTIILSIIMVSLIVIFKLITRKKGGRQNEVKAN